MTKKRMKDNKSKGFFKSFSHITLCLILWIGCIGNAVGQQYVVEGQIKAADTEEPIPFANIYFKNSQNGIATDSR